MRNMAFSLTTPQMRARTKKVTRRLGWEFLNPGDVVMAIVKGQGLGKGGKVERIHPIRVKDVRREQIDQMLADVPYGIVEVAREGFPDMTPEQFVAMFCKHNRCLPETVITRIEFEHLSDYLACTPPACIPAVYVVQAYYRGRGRAHWRLWVNPGRNINPFDTAEKADAFAEHLKLRKWHHVTVRRLEQIEVKG